jgi:quercetin dioxygenase-like cupin family protein
MTRTNHRPRSDAWNTAVTVLEEATPPSYPDGAHAMTVLIEFPPGDPGTPRHRHTGPAFGYVREGEMSSSSRASRSVWSARGRRYGNSSSR